MATDEKHGVVFKEEGQEYAQVARKLSNSLWESMCIDGTKRMCHIRGKMQKKIRGRKMQEKVWNIAAGDIILLCLRDYEDAKTDFILKYTPDEASLLKDSGELPENIRINEGIAAALDDDEDYIEFEDADIDKI